MKCLISSFGRADIASAKCVMAGKISIGGASSGAVRAEALVPWLRDPNIENLGGLFRVNRGGCDLRPPVKGSADVNFELFIVGNGVDVHGDLKSEILPDLCRQGFKLLEYPKYFIEETHFSI